ncbi:hypothetical protein HBZS_115310 [Helicobacter bizzozeronii CCUG 35545]|nr:hypothetical protein HBZS_115310 [Helicobacter bizzozeronii CCUG 35545]
MQYPNFLLELCQFFAKALFAFFRCDVGGSLVFMFKVVVCKTFPICCAIKNASKESC